MTLIMPERHNRTRRTASMQDRITFRLLVALCFAVCLVGIAFTRVFSVGAPNQFKQSIIAEARSAAYAAAGYAFSA